MEYVAEITCGMHKVFEHVNRDTTEEAFSESLDRGSKIFNCPSYLLSVQLWRKEDSAQLQP